MASLTIPTFRAWQRALAEHRGEGLDPNSGWGVLIALAVGTVILGFALGWQRRWTALWIAVGLGALVMSVRGMGRLQPFVVWRRAHAGAGSVLDELRDTRRPALVRRGAGSVDCYRAASL
jgi:hypothetical protein